MKSRKWLAAAALLVCLAMTLRASPDKFNFLVKAQETFQGKSVYRLTPVYPVDVLMEQTQGPAIIVKGDALSCKVGRRVVGEMERDGEKTAVVETILSCDRGVKLALRFVEIH